MRKTRENPKYKPINTKVLDNIKFRRNILGLKQTEVAEYLGISQENYSEYERGYRILPPALLYSIAHAFSCSVSDFFEGCSIKDKKLKVQDLSVSELTFQAKQVAHMFEQLPEESKIHYFGFLENIVKNKAKENQDEEKQEVLFEEA